MSPAGNKLDLKLQHLRELLPKLKPVERPFFDLTNPGWILIIWDILFGIPFSLFIGFVNKVFMQWLGYEKIMRCPSVLASRVLMVLVNLIVILSWREQLVQEEQEARVKTEIKMLDEVIACLEKVLTGCEAEEIDEKVTKENDNPRKGGRDPKYVVTGREGLEDTKPWTEWNQMKKVIAGKI